MADQLAAPADLGVLLGTTVDVTQATLLVECATAVVQVAAGGQRIVDLTTTALIDVDPAAGGELYLDLPQLPVRSVAAVTIDGLAVTDWKLTGQRLWRASGWCTGWTPVQVAATNSHGHPAGAQALQLARSAVLGLCRPFVANPGGATRVTIDDYTAVYEAMATAMQASPYLAAAIRSAYGRGAYVTGQAL